MKIATKAQAQSVNDKDYTINVVMSVEVEDRQGDIVDINTLSWDNFLLNPVLLQYHDYNTHPVGKITKIWKGISNGVSTLEATIKFAVEEYEVAKTMFNLYKGGYMNAFSIGFSVGRVEKDVESDVYRLYEAELLELSCVAVPANQLALAKSKGLEVKSLVKAMPNEALQKELKDLLIGVKGLLSEEGETKKEVTNDLQAIKQVVKEEKNVILVKEQIKARIFKISLEKAIRQL